MGTSEEGDGLMAQVEITGKTIVDWIFRVLALAAPLAFGWAWNTARDMALMQQQQQMNEAALVEKLADLKEDYEDKIAANDAAHKAEMTHLKAQMSRIDSISASAERQADDNAKKLVEIDVKMDQAKDTLDEIKKAVVSR